MQQSRYTLQKNDGHRSRSYFNKRTVGFLIGNIEKRMPYTATVIRSDLSVINFAIKRYYDIELTAADNATLILLEAIQSYTYEVKRSQKTEVSGIEITE